MLLLVSLTGYVTKGMNIYFYLSPFSIFVMVQDTLQAYTTDVYFVIIK